MRDDRVKLALAILRDAQERAAERERQPIVDPEWGEWYRRADQRTIYESAVERAIKVLEGSGE